MKGLKELTLPVRQQSDKKADVMDQLPPCGDKFLISADFL